MSDTITRWECPKCGRADANHWDDEDTYNCPGVPVERTYVAVDALREALALVRGLADQQAMPDDWHEAPLARLEALAAINAVTGEQA